MDNTIAKQKWNTIVERTEPIVSAIQQGTFTPSDLETLAYCIDQQSHLASLAFEAQLKAFNLKAKEFRPQVIDKLIETGAKASDANVNRIVAEIVKRLVANNISSIMETVKKATFDDNQKVQQRVTDLNNTLKSFRIDARKISQDIGQLTSIEALVKAIPDNVSDRIKDLLGSQKQEPTPMVDQHVEQQITNVDTTVVQQTTKDVGQTLEPPKVEAKAEDKPKEKRKVGRPRKHPVKDKKVGPQVQNKVKQEKKKDDSIDNLFKRLMHKVDWLYSSVKDKIKPVETNVKTDDKQAKVEKKPEFSLKRLIKQIRKGKDALLRKIDKWYDKLANGTELMGDLLKKGAITALVLGTLYQLPWRDLINHIWNQWGADKVKTDDTTLNDAGAVTRINGKDAQGLETTSFGTDDGSYVNVKQGADGKVQVTHSAVPAVLEKEGDFKGWQVVKRERAPDDEGDDVWYQHPQTGVTRVMRTYDGLSKPVDVTQSVLPVNQNLEQANPGVSTAETTYHEPTKQAMSSSMPVANPAKTSTGGRALDQLRGMKNPSTSTQTEEQKFKPTSLKSVLEKQQIQQKNGTKKVAAGSNSLTQSFNLDTTKMTGSRDSDGLAFLNLGAL